MFNATSSIFSKTLVAMATDNSHRLCMEKMAKMDEGALNILTKGKMDNI